MGQTNSTPATIEDLIDLQEKCHVLHDLVSGEVGTATENAKVWSKDLKSNLDKLDEGIRAAKYVVVEDKAPTEKEAEILRYVSTIQYVIDETIDNIKKMITGELVNGMTGVLNLAVVMGDEFEDPPNDLVAAFCSITLAFMHAFTANQSASFGYIINEVNVNLRTKEDNNRLAELRDKVKTFIDTEVPLYGEPKKKEFPLELDILTELNLASTSIVSRFCKSASTWPSERDDSTKAVSAYCFLNTLHVHLLMVLLLQFRALERKADVVCVVNRLETLKNRVYEELGFWVRFWQDFQNDLTRKTFFNLVPEFDASSSVVAESRKLGTSVLCATAKGVLIVQDHSPQEVYVFKSDYDFKPIQVRPRGILMLASMYKLDRSTEGEDPTIMRLFCQAFLDISAIPNADLTSDDKDVFRTILMQTNFPPRKSWWCTIL